MQVRRTRAANAIGEPVLFVLERLPAAARGAAREALWRRRAYFVITPGPNCVRGALVGYPAEVRRLCADAPFYRYDDRGGGGFWPDRNEVWLAAGVETYESRRQVYNSARHELFHYVCWNHPAYRLDEEHGFPHLERAIADSRALLDRYPGYVEFLHSFIPFKDRANPVEFFSDVPTNIRHIGELPPPLARYFGPLIWGHPVPAELLRHGPRRPVPREGAALAAFQELLDPATGLR